MNQWSLTHESSFSRSAWFYGRIFLSGEDADALDTIWRNGSELDQMGSNELDLMIWWSRSDALYGMRLIGAWGEINAWWSFDGFESDSKLSLNFWPLLGRSPSGERARCEVLHIRYKDLQVITTYVTTDEARWKLIHENQFTNHDVWIAVHTLVPVYHNENLFGYKICRQVAIFNFLNFDRTFRWIH